MATKSPHKEAQPMLLPISEPLRHTDKQKKQQHLNLLTRMLTRHISFPSLGDPVRGKQKRSRTWQYDFFQWGCTSPVGRAVKGEKAKPCTRTHLQAASPLPPACPPKKCTPTKKKILNMVPRGGEVKSLLKVSWWRKWNSPWILSKCSWWYNGCAMGWGRGKH